MFLVVRRGLVPLIYCLDFCSVLIVMGVMGIIYNKRDLLRVLLCIELVFISLSINFLFISMFNFEIIGQLYSLLILIFAAAETTIALSIIIIYFRLGKRVNSESLTILRG